MTAQSTRKGKSRYKLINWPEYNKSLVNRGKITIWFSEDAIKDWHPHIEKKPRGGQELYSPAAIQTCLTMKHLFKLGYRQTEGFMTSLIEMLDVAITSPEFSTISRRSIDLEIVSSLGKLEGDIDVLVDSTGLKVYGAGEWCEAKHGKTKRRKWKKLHLAVDKDTQDIVASTLTDEHMSDPSQVLPLLDKVDTNITSFSADGVYEGIDIRKGLEGRNIKCIVPPPSNAVLSKDSTTSPTQRDLDIMRIQKDGRKIWEYASGYSKRNMVENAMFRFKQIIGDKLRSRSENRQGTEIAIGIHILNKMVKLGMPDSVRI